MRCPFCGNGQYPQGDKVGSDVEGRVVLTFDSGMKYDVPVNLDHFIIAHDFLPPGSLIGDVMNARHVPEGVVHAQGTVMVVEVDEDYPMGTVPMAMPYRLREYIKTATVST